MDYIFSFFYQKVTPIVNKTSNTPNKPNTPNTPNTWQDLQNQSIGSDWFIQSKNY